MVESVDGLSRVVGLLVGLIVLGCAGIVEIGCER